MPAPAAATPRDLLKPALVALLSLPLLAAGILLQHQAGTITGPLAIAVDDGGNHVAVARGGNVYHLDAGGTLTGTDEALLDPAAPHVGLAFVGSDLFASPDPDGDLLRCNDEACSLFSEDTWAPRGAVHVLAVENRLWFSETDTERLQRFFDDGRRIDMPVSDLSRPGSLWLDGDQLYIANAGSREIRRYRLHKRGIDEPEAFATFSTGDEDAPVNRPCCFVRHASGFSAIFSDEARRHGVLTRIDDNGNVDALPVAGLVNPVALAALGDALLVVDEDGMQVLKVDADGNAAPFGDEAFRAELAQGQGLRAALRILAPLLVLLAALVAAAGGSWLLLRLSRRRGDPVLPVSTAADGVRWLPRECDRAGDHLPWALLVAAPAALLPAAAAAWFDLLPAGILWAVLVFGAAAARPLLAAARAKPPFDLRIGTRGKQLVVADTDKGLREYPLPQIHWNERELRLAPDVLVALVRDGVPVFHAPTLASALFPHLNPALRLPD